MTDLSYVDSYRNLDIDSTPELYRIGRGQMGVLIIPWSVNTVIKPLWRFKNPEIAQWSSDRIHDLFLDCLSFNKFPHADLCKKALHMGFTRSMRYWNHSSGKKYDDDKQVLPKDHVDYDKYLSSRIFLNSWTQARTNSKYLELKAEHKRRYES